MMGQPEHRLDPRYVQIYLHDRQREINGPYDPAQKQNKTNSITPIHLTPCSSGKLHQLSSGEQNSFNLSRVSILVYPYRLY